MAIVGESVLYSDDLSTEIDLLSGTWRHEWGAAVSPVNEDDALKQLQSGSYIQMAFPLVATISGDYANAGESISILLEEARQWKDDPLAHNPTWWKVRAYGQTAKRFLVIGGQFAEIDRPGAASLDDDELRRGNLILYLHIGPPEDNIARYFGDFSAAVGIGGQKSMVGSPTYPVASGDGTDVSALGGILQVTGNGTRPGRISLIEMVNNDTTAANALNNIWIGLKRTSRTVTEDPTTFNPNLTTLTVDAGTPYTNASGGAGENTYKEFVVANNSGNWGECFYAAFPRSGVTSGHAIGDYLLLLRYKIAATAGSGDKPIRMRTAFGLGTGSFVYNEPIYINQPATMSNFGILPIGFLKYPHLTARYDSYSLADIRVKLQANTLDSGDTVTVQFNRFITIPVPYVYVASTDLYNTRRLLYKMHPNDMQEAIVFTTASGLPSVPSVPYKEVDAELSPDFYMPIQGGTLVILGARSLSNQNEADVVDIGAIVYDRYMSWKGDV